MQIEHVAMYVEDLEKTKDFFIKYFDAKAGERYYNFRLEAERKSMNLPRDFRRTDIKSSVDRG